MLFTQDNVEDLAYLARLATDHSIVEDLNKILQLVSKISEINTDNIEPMEHAQQVSQRCREDVVTETNQRDLLQKSVPADAIAAGLYLVPKVVE